MTADPVRRGRGAAHNCANRFDRTLTEPFDDGWRGIETERTAPPSVATSLLPDRSRSAIVRNTSPDLGFDRAVNPYRGCEHGCIYCYARPTHAWLGYSPGLDFETRLTFKPEVASLLDRELRRPGYAPRPLALGTNTDPYQPVERTLCLTRQVLEVLERFNHPVTIVTKSAGVLRDVDILQRMAGRRLVQVWVSVTTLDPVLARRMEPRAASPARRLAAIEQLAAAAIPVGVLAAPMVPGLNDCELERILEAASSAGAAHAGYTLLRLPGEVADLFERWLHQHYPQRAAHVLKLIRDTRGGALNDPRFAHRFNGEGAYAALLGQRFALAARKTGLHRPPPLDIRRFAVPPAETAQLALF